VSLIPLEPFSLVGLSRARRVLLIDSNNIGWRSWHSKGYSFMTGSNGQRSGHVFGFCKTVLAFLRQRTSLPTSVVYAIDGHPVDKYAAFPEYKGNRSRSHAHGDPMPDVTRLVQHLPGYVLHHPEHEADDVIASFEARFRKRERRAGRRQQARIIVVSGDHDMLQLATKNTVIQPRAGDSPVAIDQIADKLHRSWKNTPPALGPEHVALWKALFGDSSDNIRGVPRLRKAPVAVVLAASDGTLANFLDRARKHLGKAHLDRLLEHENVVQANLELIRLRRKLRVWPQRTKVDARVLHRLVVKQFGCVSLAEDLERMTGGNNG